MALCIACTDTKNTLKAAAGAGQLPVVTDMLGIIAKRRYTEVSVNDALMEAVRASQVSVVTHILSLRGENKPGEEVLESARKVAKLKPDNTIDLLLAEKQCDLLAEKVNQAAQEYCTFKDSNPTCSFFGMRGEKSRTRPSELRKIITEIRSVEEMQRTIIDFLSNSKNGKTEDYSLRTRVLKAVVPSPPISLKVISQQFDTQLDVLKKAWKYNDPPNLGHTKLEI